MRYAISENLAHELEKLKGPFKNYKRLENKEFPFKYVPGTLKFLHIQGSPDAFPASLIEIELPCENFYTSCKDIEHPAYKLAVSDYITRALKAGIEKCTKPLKGLGSSGSFQPPEVPQEILEKNIVDFKKDEGKISLWVRISLAGNNREANIEKSKDMLLKELPEVLNFIEKETLYNKTRFEKHIQIVFDYYRIQDFLKKNGFIAFVADGSILPRESGISELPLKNAVPFKSPKSLKVKINLGKGRIITGMAIPNGVTVIVGGGYHGKSTLLNALIKGVYPHIHGDGREYVVSLPRTIKLRAEDGRSVTGVDISGFIRNLPSGKNPESFFSQLSSGSTSEAASLVEFASTGTEVFLFDEDDSATNFLIKDPFMREIISVDPIIPLVDRAYELKNVYGISLVIIAGASSLYISVADTVIEMKNYLPFEITEKAKSYEIPPFEKPEKPLKIEDKRRLCPENFDPSYIATRHAKFLPSRIKPLRLDPKKLEYGNEIIDLSAIETLVDSEQLMTIGLLLKKLRETGFLEAKPTISETVCKSLELLDKGGLRELAENYYYLAKPRIEELVAAINRVRSLKICGGIKNE